MYDCAGDQLKIKRKLKPFVKKAKMPLTNDSWLDNIWM